MIWKIFTSSVLSITVPISGNRVSNLILSPRGHNNCYKKKLHWWVSYELEKWLWRRGTEAVQSDTRSTVTSPYINLLEQGCTTSNQWRTALYLRNLHVGRIINIIFSYTPTNICSAIITSMKCELDPWQTYKGKVNPVNRPWRPVGLWDVEVPTFSLDDRLSDGGKFVSLTRRPPLTLQDDSRYSFLSEAESTPAPYFGWKD
jgi:hypothetical protein